MKTKLIIASWLTSFMFMATDNIIQAFIALCWFAISSWMLQRNRKQCINDMDKAEEKINNLLNTK